MCVCMYEQDLILNNLEVLIYNKFHVPNQPTNQPTNQTNKLYIY